MKNPSPSPVKITNIKQVCGSLLPDPPPASLFLRTQNGLKIKIFLRFLESVSSTFRLRSSSSWLGWRGKVFMGIRHQLGFY